MFLLLLLGESFDFSGSDRLFRMKFPSKSHTILEIAAEGPIHSYAKSPYGATGELLFLGCGVSQKPARVGKDLQKELVVRGQY